MILGHSASLTFKGNLYVYVESTEIHRNCSFQCLSELKDVEAASQDKTWCPKSKKVPKSDGFSPSFPRAWAPQPCRSYWRTVPWQRQETTKFQCCQRIPHRPPSCTWFSRRFFRFFHGESWSMERETQNARIHLKSALTPWTQPNWISWGKFTETAEFGLDFTEIITRDSR